MAETAHAAELLCRNCGHALSGAYCPVCGQAGYDGHPPTFGHFLHDLVHEFLHVDLSLLSPIDLFLALGRLFHERWYARLFRTLALCVFLPATEPGLGLAAGWWGAHLAAH
jgi:hypothetical protein